MRKYLYLTKSDWTEAWIDGGKVPLSRASRYKSIERSGVRTPDENLIHNSPVDLTSLRAYGFHLIGKDITIKDCKFNERSLPNLENVDYYNEDGLVLCVSNVASPYTMDRLQKEACIVINNVALMKSQIDEQLKATGIAANCQYTTDHQRNHFLKHTSDAWQQEFRIFWPIQENTDVNIPPGFATRVIF